MRQIYIFYHISLISSLMRNVAGKSYRENQNTRFVFSNLFSKIVSFMKKKCRKILYSGTGHNENMAHAHCMLDT